MPAPNSGPVSIVGGPDGALWFTEINANEIGRITTDGEITTVVAPGTDGSVWFTERGTAGRPGDKTGRVVLTNGQEPFVEEFRLPETIPPELAPVLPVATPPYGRRPLGITAGPDGAMWFAQERMHQIGRIDPHTLEISEYPLPNLAFRRQRFEITAGPDGHMWFTEAFGNRIGRISTAGDIVEFRVPTPRKRPQRHPPRPRPARRQGVRAGVAGGRVLGIRDLWRLRLPARDHPDAVVHGVQRQTTWRRSRQTSSASTRSPPRTRSRSASRRGRTAPSGSREMVATRSGG